MTIVEIFFPMRQASEYMDDSPTDEKTDNDISWIVYSGDNTRKAGDKTQDKKRYRHTRFAH